MRFRWVRMKEMGADLELIYGSIGLLLFLFFRFIPNTLFENFPCLFRQYSTIPCPSCGSSRAFLLISRAEIAEGLAMNPLFGALFLAGMLFVLYSLVITVFRLKRLRLVAFSSTGAAVVGCLGLIALVGNWVYLIYAKI